MAEKAKKIKTGKGLKLAIVNPDAAGIDVSSTGMQVSVPEDRDGLLKSSSREVLHRQKADICPPLLPRQTSWGEYSTRWSETRWSLTNLC